MLEAVIEVARQVGLGPIVAVVPPGTAVPPDVVPVPNDAPGEGMSRSLRMGIAALPEEIDAAVVLLGDQPTLRAEVIRSLIAAADRSDRSVMAAHADGRLGPPVLIRRAAFGLAGAASGDEGLRSILGSHPELVARVEVGEHAPDVDTPADLERLT